MRTTPGRGAFVAAIFLAAPVSARAEEAAALSAQSVAPGPTDAWVRAHVSPSGLRLESTADRLDDDNPPGKGAWSFVCDSPCGDWVSRLRYYRLRTPEGTPTPPFRMVWEEAPRPSGGGQAEGLRGRRRSALGAVHSGAQLLTPIH